MKKQIPVWQRVIIFLMLGIGVFALPFALPSDFSAGPFPILGLFFILEALAQPNPSEQKTPLYQLVGRYSNRRDRFVAGIALAVLLVVLYLPSILLHKTTVNANWLVLSLIAVLTTLSAIGLYFAVALYFGSSELREMILPKIVKKILEKRNQGTQ